MYAVIKTGGKQFKVEPGYWIDIEKLPNKIGEKVIFNQVLMINDGKKSSIGTPFLESVKVIGKVLNHEKKKKVFIFKMRSKKGYRKLKCHRQPFSRVMIEDIDATSLGYKKIVKKVDSLKSEEKTVPEMSETKQEISEEIQKEQSENI